MITHTELRALGKVFQIVVTTPDGPVAGMTLDPRNCFGTDGRKFDPSGPDGEALRALPAHHRRALARQVLRGGLSYGINDAKLSAARLAWVMEQLPFEELALFAADPYMADRRAVRQQSTEIDNLVSALVVRAAAEGTGFLRENPTLALLLSDRIKYAIAVDSPQWRTKDNQRKHVAISRKLDDVSGELYDLLNEFADPDKRVAALTALSSGSDPVAADKARAASAVLDPDTGVRSYAAAAITAPDIRCEAAAVLSCMAAPVDPTERLSPYLELLNPLLTTNAGPLPELANIVALLPSEARAYVYENFLGTTTDENWRRADDAKADRFPGIRESFNNEPDPMLTAAYVAGVHRRGETLDSWVRWENESSDQGLKNRLRGVVSDERGWVPSAAFDMFSADTAAKVLAGSYPPDGDESQEPALPCYDAWLRRAMVERLLGEMANPDLDESQREKYASVVRAAALHDPCTDVRRIVLASETLAALGDETRFYARVARVDADAGIRSAAAERLDDDSERLSFVSGVTDRTRVENFRRSAARLPSEREVAGESPLEFRGPLTAKFSKYSPPRYHNGDLSYEVQVDDMSRSERLQLVAAVRAVKHWNSQSSYAFGIDCLLAEVISSSDCEVACEAALVARDPLLALEGLVERLSPDAPPAGLSHAMSEQWRTRFPDDDLPDTEVLVELARRSTSLVSHARAETTPEWLLAARDAHPDGSSDRRLLDRCIAVFPDGADHTSGSSDERTRLLAARGRRRPEGSMVVTELVAGALPSALALVDRVDPSVLDALERDVAAVPESPERDMVLAQVRERAKAVSRLEDGSTSGAPVVNWHGDTPIRIHYETRGPADGEPVVLLMGQMMQLNAWPEKFVDGLLEAGHRVILVDNRDIGHSTKLAGVPVDSDAAVAATLCGRRAPAPYSLGDMADDVSGLLEHLDIPQARVVGQSMGGMIAQEMAIRHPDKVKAIVSLSSMTGDPTEMQSTPEAMLAVTSVPAFTGDPSTDRDVFIEHSVVYQEFASRKYRDDGRSKAAAAASWDRAAPDEGSFPRQLAAIYASGNRTEALAKVAAVREPGFVTFVHGTDDTLISPQASRYAASRCAKSSGVEPPLVIVEDMGHDLPVELCDRIVSIVAGGH